MAVTIFPRPLAAGDRIAILSPASIINPEYVDGAVKALERLGWHPYVSAHALGSYGSYSGTREERLADLNEALRDPSVRAILCSRGGYGAVHLLDGIDGEAFSADPKWIIGFSDVSALHAYAAGHNIASLHSSMCKHLANFGTDEECSRRLIDILTGKLPHYTVSTHPYNRKGHAEGRIAGGNLAVISALISTPWDPFAGDGDILVIEDIAEPIYKVERILYQLKLAGVFSRISGLVVGQFTEYRPDKNYSDMYDMIRDAVAGYDFPVAFNFPIGHVDRNLPVVMSAQACLDVNDDEVTLRY